MKEFWNTIQLIFAAVGGWLGYFLGGCDGLLIALIIFVVCDYITGVLCAISDRKLSSAVGFKGICRKVLIFILVGIANILDIHVLGHEGVLRTAIIFFYIYPAAVKKRFTVWMAQWSSRYTYSGTYHPRERSAASAGTSTWTSTSQAQ